MSEQELLDAGIPMGQDNGITTDLTIKELDVFSTSQLLLTLQWDKIISIHIAGFNISLAVFQMLKFV